MRRSLLVLFGCGWILWAHEPPMQNPYYPPQAWHVMQAFDSATECEGFKARESKAGTDLRFKRAWSTQCWPASIKPWEMR